jgi:selenocysteine lyase/cysteine desulfurase
VIGSLVPRESFPGCLETVYLDTANDGVASARLVRECEAFVRDASPGRRGYGELRRAAYERPRGAVARLLGASPDEIAITHNASEALGQVAWALRPGDGANVVSVAYEFPTVTYPWLRLASETGLELRLAPAASVDALAGLVDERTAAVAVSHVQFATGERLPLAAVADLAHAHGALLAVDTAQSAGAVPLDVRVDGVDVLVGTGGKFLCGEFGAGFLYVRRDLVERLVPPLLGWRSTVEPWSLDGTRIDLAPTARRFEISSVSYLARHALAVAVDEILGVGVAAIAEHHARLTARLIEGLDALGAELVTPREPAWRAGIVVAAFPGRDHDALRAALARDGVQVSARGGGLRFSVHLYNDEGDIASGLSALRRALAR